MWLMNNLLELRHQYGDDAPVKSFSGAIKTYLEEEHVSVPEALETENDDSVLLTRRQVNNAIKSTAAQDNPDPSGENSQVT